MKINSRFLFTIFVLMMSISSCSFISNPLATKGVSLYPIIQAVGTGPSGEKFGYINSSGDVVIEPQFAQAWPFSEGLAVACSERGKCGYIDETGKYVINPQFQTAGRFSGGLAVVIVENKLGYIDSTGNFVIKPQFDAAVDSDIGSLSLGAFSEGLAAIRLGEKIGYIDRLGKISINPQFIFGAPFTEGLAAVGFGLKMGYIDKEGKITINPQFDEAHPFVNGLAAVKIDEKWGYIDRMGKIVINPQFSFAGPFATEGLAIVFLNDKAGYIDRDGKYIVNPQFVIPLPAGRPDELVWLAHLITSDIGRVSFSEGFGLANTGSASDPRMGYIDRTGKMVINPQFQLALPFIGELAPVFLTNGQPAWINKEGKIIWRVAAFNRGESATNANANANHAVSNAMNTAANVTNASTNSSYSSERTGRLTTDSNIRGEGNKDSVSLGIHYKGARVRILDETSYMRDDGMSTWYKIRVVENGCSANANLGCGKDPNTSDEGWVNAKNVLID